MARFRASVPLNVKMIRRGSSGTKQVGQAGPRGLNGSFRFRRLGIAAATSRDTTSR